MDGQPDNYIGRQDLGDGDGTLTDHIEKYHAYYENNADWDNLFYTVGERKHWKRTRHSGEMLLHEFVPYLKLHNNLSKHGADRHKSVAGKREHDTHETAYHTAMKEYVSKCRTMVNSGDYNLPPPAAQRL